MLNIFIKCFPKEEIIMAVTKEELIQMVKNYKVNTEEILKRVTDDSEREEVCIESEKFNNTLELLALCEKDETACKDEYYKIVFNSSMGSVGTPFGSETHIEFIVINKESTLFMRKCVYEVRYNNKTETCYMGLGPITNGFNEFGKIIVNASYKRMFSKESIDRAIARFIDSTISSSYEYEWDDEYNGYYEVVDQCEPESKPAAKPVEAKRQVVEDPETHKRYYIVPVDEVPSTPPYVYQRPYPTVPGLSNPTISYGMGPYGYYGPTPITPHFSTGYYTKE